VIPAFSVSLVTDEVFPAGPWPALLSGPLLRAAYFGQG